VKTDLGRVHRPAAIAAAVRERNLTTVAEATHLEHVAAGLSVHILAAQMPLGCKGPIDPWRSNSRQDSLGVSRNTLNKEESIRWNRQTPGDPSRQVFQLKKEERHVRAFADS